MMLEEYLRREPVRGTAFPSPYQGPRTNIMPQPAPPMQFPAQQQQQGGGGMGGLLGSLGPMAGMFGGGAPDISGGGALNSTSGLGGLIMGPSAGTGAPIGSAFTAIPMF